MIIRIEDSRTGSNCYVITSQKHAVVIDPNNYQKICKCLDEHQLQPDMILLTHEHFDHITGLEELRQKYGIPVLATRHASEGIQDTKRNLSPIYDLFVYYRTRKIALTRRPSFTCAAAEQIFEEELSLQWKDSVFYFRRVPGHSDGSCMITMDNKYLFSGDYLIKHEDLIAGFFGGDKSVYAERTLPYIKALPLGIMVYPGHGEAYTLTKEMKTVRNDVKIK